MAHELRQSTPENRPLLERRKELRALDSALVGLRDTVDGVPQAPRGGLLAFTGPAGMGKTSLLTEARARAREQGFTVLSGRGGEKEQGLAFHLVRQVVQPALASMDEDGLRAFLGGWYAIVGSALGLVATPGGHVPDPTGVRDGLDWVMTRLAVTRTPMVLLLDDLHWADVESLTWLASFAPRAVDLSLLIVVAFRPDELPPEAAAFGSAADLGTRPFTLAPLSSAAVARIVRDEVGEEAEDAFCEECWEITGGSPFEAVELSIRLGERNLRGTGEDLPAMRDLAAAVKGPGLIERLQHLGTTTVRFAYAAAVLGQAISPELACPHRGDRRHRGGRGHGEAAHRPRPGRRRRVRRDAGVPPPADRHHDLPVHQAESAGGPAQRGRRSRPGGRARLRRRGPAPAGGPL
ncbi:ATP-binding protein [Streptomyces indiaensis]|uniref:Orc1-like AAA ATPase domain-containing protein n=1 Tax=Streptomyces indiaensis TaxID=284033 RepID=A0ABP5RBW1_9ACTN|nr:ATP-binding protein [Streptomyces indiaensis]